MSNTEDYNVYESNLEQLAEKSGKSTDELEQMIEVADTYEALYSVLNQIAQEENWIPMGSAPITFMSITQDITKRRYIKQTDDGWKLVTKTISDEYTYESEYFDITVQYAVDNPCSDFD